MPGNYTVILIFDINDQQYVCTYLMRKMEARGNGGIEAKTHEWNLSRPIQINRGNGISRKRKSHKRRRECNRFHFQKINM